MDDGWPLKAHEKVDIHTAWMGMAPILGHGQ